MTSPTLARPDPGRPSGGARAAAGSRRPPLPSGLDTARIGSLAVLTLLTVTWSWWAIKQGAYFGVVLYPGLVLLCAGLVLLLRDAPWRGDFRLSRPVALALYGIFGLAAWSALSAVWSPSPDVAIADAQRIAGYGLAFGLGLWLCNLLGPRMHLALASLAIAGAVAGLVAVVTLATGDDVRTYLDGDGTLQYPLGYRNANAAFFAIAVWPALALARSRELHFSLRAAALAPATLCVELALLSQSRGSVIGAAVALAVYTTLSPGRARSLVWLALAVLPALLILPSLTELYSAANEVGLKGALEHLPAAGRAALAGALLAAVAGAIVARLEARFPLREEAEARADRIATRGVIAAVGIGIVAFVIATGNPVDWVGQRVEQFRSEGSPEFSGEASRFGFNTGTERGDLWRIALEDAGADPLFGDGGGGFQYSYLRERTNAQQNARDAHSVELEVLAELGLPGLALLAMALAGATTAALRARRLGPSAAALSAAALTAGAYWLGHASLDWFWAYPAVTVPVFALLGSACAPVVLAPRRRRSSGRRWLTVGAVALALSVVPPYLSERYTNEAFATWPLDLQRAYDDLERARSLNPLAEEPLLAEGAIAQEAGDRERAITAFRKATERRPEEWAAHYFLASLLVRQSPGLAARELDVATELNPLSDRLDALRAELNAAQAKQDGRGRRDRGGKS